jgi:hypothetical protein
MSDQNGRDIREVPLSAVGMTPLAAKRRVRAIHEAGIERLKDTDPDVWEPIIVRAWPADEPHGEGVEWEVISGNHRTTYARMLDLATLRIDVVDAPTDREYMLIGWHENLKSPLPMSDDENKALTRHLRDDLGLSFGDIAKAIGKAKGTVQDWYSGRNTNARRQVGGYPPTERNDTPVEGVGWLVTPTPNPTSGVLRKMGQRISDFLAATPDGKVTPEDALAWVRSLGVEEARSMAGDVAETREWLGKLHTALVSGEQEATA